VAGTVDGALRAAGDITANVRRRSHDERVAVSRDVRGIVTRVIAASWIALALLAIEPAPTGPSSEPCPPTSFAGAPAFLVVGKVSGKAREAIGAAQRARAAKVEATVVRGALFEAAGKGTLVVYGAFAGQADASARVAALAKKKIAAAVLPSGKPSSAAPVVRVCGDARRAAWASEKPAADPRFSYVPIDIVVGDARYVTETDRSGYFELWLAGAGRAHVQIAPFKPETRDANQWCGFMGTIEQETPIGDEADVPLPTASGGSIRTRPLGQTITICAE
jgi:hypothetical protein